MRLREGTVVAIGLGFLFFRAAVPNNLPEIVYDAAASQHAGAVCNPADGAKSWA